VFVSVLETLQVGKLLVVSSSLYEAGKIMNDILQNLLSAFGELISHVLSPGLFAVWEEL
jgi:hypothetical protein